MSKSDSHNIAFNLASSIGSNNRAPTLFPEEYDAWVVHIEDYITGIKKVGIDLCNPIVDGPHRNDEVKTSITTMKEYKLLQERYPNLSSGDKCLIEADLHAKRELIFGLTPSSLRLIEPCQTAHDIWIKLRDSYGTNELLDSIQSSLLADTGRLNKL